VTAIQPRRSRLYIPLALGAIGALATPPLDQHWLVWPVLAGFSWSLFSSPEPTHDARWRRFLARMKPGIAFGFSVNFVLLRFVVPTITRFTSLSTPIAALCLCMLSLAQAVGWGVGGSVARSLANRGVPRYLAFTVGVYLAMFCPSIFPWSVVGGITPWPAMLQLAEFIGERGVTAVVALQAGLLAEAIELVVRGRGKTGTKAAATYGALGAALIGLTWLQGTMRMKSVDAMRDAAPHARVSLVQPGVNAIARWDDKRAPEILTKLNSLTKNAESRGTDLVVWPESAYPYPLLHSAKRTPPGDVAPLQEGVHGPVLFGAYMRDVRVDGAQDSFNSATVAFGNGDLARAYDKRTLLWFGETVPLADEIPWLRDTFSRGTGLVPGDGVVRLDAGRIHAGVLICYEDTITTSGRDMMWVEPNLLVNITNDAWFSGTSEGELHLRLSTLRAIEMRRDLARAVNLGPTSFVDAAGRVRARYNDILPAAVPVDVALIDGPKTFFASAGHAPVNLALIAACWLPMRRAKRAAEEEEAKAKPSAKKKKKSALPWY
jgi:apolipoprotein N-acyltransferase